MKKILIVSNNSLSETTNNGKTIASFFESYPEELLGQIYFENRVPDYERNILYYRITDKDNVLSVFTGKKECGTEVKAQKKEINYNKKKKITVSKNFNILRLFREYIWEKKKWENVSLKNWIDRFKPDVIFFYAGDSLFAYKVVNYIQKICKSQLAVYIADDYILPRTKISFAGKIRQRYVKKYMTDFVKRADYFFTISDEMRKVYQDIWGKDSVCIMNLPHIEIGDSQCENKEIVFTYCGGLEFGRAKTLGMLAKRIYEYNKMQNGIKAMFNIYSLDHPTSKELKGMNRGDSCFFKGSINRKEVNREIRNSDVLVHIECFDKKSIESTRLSVSTKISEYLCSGKPILAIGPKDVASMKYLRDTACCIYDEESISRYIPKLIENKEYRKSLARKSEKKYKDVSDRMPQDLVIKVLNDEI